MAVPRRRGAGEPWVDDPGERAAAAAVGRAGLGPVDRVEPLGGMTNRNYRVDTLLGAFAVRLPGAGSDAYIDRGVEAHNARAAAGLGLNCDVLHLDPDGTMVCRFVEGEVVAPEDLAADGDRLEQLARTLWRLHTLAPPFRGRFDPVAEARRHRRSLAVVPDGVDDLLAEIDGFDLVAPLSPCHNDAWPPNVVFRAEGGPVLVDWEYSAMNDPAWDLAHLSVECGLDDNDHERLLRAYAGGRPPADLRRRVGLLRGVSDVVWGLWALVQHADANPATDFESYAETRLRRAPNWW
ncbi:MAG TPA: choline kinase family protein [Acidimicrobiales bacterium]|nr:choline kinase family protein [Acidimicrobiales bacterium]